MNVDADRAAILPRQNDGRRCAGFTKVALDDIVAWQLPFEIGREDGERAEGPGMIERYWSAIKHMSQQLCADETVEQRMIELVLKGSEAPIAG